jgi:hypothetical protein
MREIICKAPAVRPEARLSLAWGSWYPRPENPEVGHPDLWVGSAPPTHPPSQPRSPRARDRGHPQLDKIPVRPGPPARVREIICKACRLRFVDSQIQKAGPGTPGHPPAHREKDAMNAEQLLMADGVSSGLMSGPPAESIITRFGISQNGLYSSPTD